MLDFELAKLYGYETKNLNRQVKNHIDLFNENILFKLTKNDVDMLLRCKIFTSIMQTEGIKGGRTSLPYAFTLDGIKALSSVLRGPDVISITSMIIEAFNDNNQRLEISKKSLNEAISYENANLDFVASYENISKKVEFTSSISCSSVFFSIATVIP